MPSGPAVTLPQLQSRSLLLGGSPKLPVFQLPQVRLSQSRPPDRAENVQDLQADIKFLTAHLKLGPHVQQLYEAELGLDRTRPSRRHLPPSTRWSKTSHVPTRKRALQPVRSHSNVSDPALTRDTLRAELIESLSAMNDFNAAVKRDLSVIRRLVPSVRNQSKSFAGWLGADKLFAIVGRMLLKQVAQRFEAWVSAARSITRAKQLEQMRKYRALKRVIVKLDQCATRKIAGWFEIWLLSTIAERDRLRRILEEHSVVLIQKLARGWLARLKLMRSRERAGYAEIYAATLRIQAFFRGRIARFAYVVAYNRHQRQRRALVIQRIGRGYVGRVKARRARLQRNRGLAATMIQAWRRGCAGRRVAAHLRWQRAEQIAAHTIQQAARRWLACQHVERIRRLKTHVQKATVLQKYTRRWLCQRRLQTTLEARQREFEVRKAAALKIQCTYRGHRARTHHKAAILQYRAQVRRRILAALTLQCAMRCRIARKKVLAVRIERMTEWVDKAKQVVEMWSEDAQAYFYYNQETGEAAWEPSPDGYTKADGQMVLLNGRIISDPLAIMDEILGQPTSSGQVSEDMLCVECSTRFAVRLCMQCEDKFCTKCFRETHTGKRGGHSYQELGLVECSECEEVLAIRWCVPCDDAFCDSCWRRLHLKGKRRLHPYSDIAADGSVSNTIVTIDGQEIEYYDPALYAQGHDFEQNGQISPDATMQQSHDPTLQQTAAEEWITYMDANQCPFYYNQRTGESTYNYPYP